MNVKSILKTLLVYREPKPYHRFELLEDEDVEKNNDPTTPDEAAAQGYESTHQGAQTSDKSNNDAGKSMKEQGSQSQSRDSQSGKKQSGQDHCGKGQDGQSQNGKQQNTKQQSGQDQGSSKSAKPMSFEEWNSKRTEKSAQSDVDSTGSSGESGNDSENSSKDQKPKHPFSNNLEENLKNIKNALNVPLNQDVVIREFKIMQKCDAFLVFIDGMADKETINDSILRQLMTPNQPEPDEVKDFSTCFVVENLLTANQIEMLSDMDSAIKQILNGLTAVFIEGDARCIAVETRGYESRSVSTPLTEAVVNGSQEAFVENLRTNLTLIRKIIKSKDLITEIRPVGKVDQINVAIVYKKEIVNPTLVKEVKRRLSSLNIDMTIGGGVLNQMVEDHPYSLFPQIISTERPDRTASYVMDGKVAVISDGTPFASIMPVTLFDMLHTSEDYVIRWQYGTFLRYIRMVAIFFAAFLPGLYIALTLYHKEMIPTELMTTFHTTREIVPFPALIEILLMEISFEIIREAGIRVPGIVGQTLGIIGAIVLGQAAVTAGLASPILIVIVAITGLGSFTIPNYSLAFSIRIMRFLFILLGAMAGFYGISTGLFILGGLACSMKSFGVPFLSPFAPKTKASSDIVNRPPAWARTERPDYLNTKNRKRANTPVRGWTEGKEGNQTE